MFHFLRGDAVNQPLPAELLALAPEAKRYRLVGRVAAGQTPRAALKPGEAMRIFTGAPVPLWKDDVKGLRG